MSSALSPPTRNRSAYVTIAVAVAAYIGGVAVFSAWSFSDILNNRDSGSMRSIYLIEGIEFLFLIALAVPMVALYHRSRVRSSQHMNVLYAKVDQDNRKLREREQELKQAIQDLERFNTLAVGRETRVLELKAEVNSLLEELHRGQRYNSSLLD